MSPHMPHHPSLPLLSPTIFNPFDWFILDNQVGQNRGQNLIKKRGKKYKHYLANKYVRISNEIEHFYNPFSKAKVC